VAQCGFAARWGSQDWLPHFALCLGERDGQFFLSMDYVDGEDLASLLRRIGHLPPAPPIASTFILDIDLFPSW
jgi:hypothetical protein